MRFLAGISLGFWSPRQTYFFDYVVDIGYSLTHLPRNDIPSGILSSNVTFLRATYFVPAVCDDRANQFSRSRAFVRCGAEKARNWAAGRKPPFAQLEITYVAVDFPTRVRHRAVEEICIRLSGLPQIMQEATT